MPNEMSRTTSSMICFMAGAICAAFRVRQNGEVAAGDIEADAGKRNLVFVRDHATDRLRVTFMTIGAKNRALAAGCDTSFNLLNGRSVVFTKNLSRCAQTSNYRPRHVPQSRACLCP